MRMTWKDSSREKRRRKLLQLQQRRRKRRIAHSPDRSASGTCWAGHCCCLSYLIRANNWVRFAEANRVVLLARQKAHSLVGNLKPVKSETIRSHVDSSSLVGVGSSVGERCSIRRSVVGANCRLGDRVKLTNCILLDGVLVEEGAVLQGAILCAGASVGVNAEIRDCIVGHGQAVHGLAKHANESLTEVMLDL